MNINHQQNSEFHNLYNKNSFSNKSNSDSDGEEKSASENYSSFNSYKEPNEFTSKMHLSESEIASSNMKEFIANDKKGKSIHSKFLYLKRQLNLGHFMRKTQIDSLLKKCKSKAFKNIYEALRKCLNTKLGRLPQLFITNIKIDFNKHYLNKSILEIYQEFNIIQSLEDLVSKGYVIESRKKILEDFLNLTFKQVYEYYINSHQFKKDYLQVCEREGQNFAILFSYIAQIFIQYYQKGRGNKRKNPTNRKLKNNNNESYSEDEESEENYNDYSDEGEQSEIDEKCK